MCELTFGEAYAEGLREEMERDSRIFVLGTDIFLRGGHFGQLRDLGSRFGRERVIDSPISEAAMLSAGMGAALTGIRPVIDLNFEDFVTGAMDELVNQIAKWSYMSAGQLQVPLVIRASDGVARAAGPQHSQSLEAWFVHTPGLQVAIPSTPADVKGLLKKALRGSNPVVFLMHKMLSRVKGPVPEGDVTVPFGRAAIRRAGNDVTIVAYGIMAVHAVKAAEELAAQGIDAEVIDLRTLSPLDMETLLQSVRKTNRAVVAHEAPKVGGLGSEIAATIQEEAFDYLDAPVLRVGAAHTPVPVAPALQDAVIPGVKQVVDAVRTLV